MGWPVDSVRAGFAGNLLLHNMKAYNALFTDKDSPHGCCTPFFSDENGDITTFLKEFLYHYTPVTEQGAYLGIPTSNHESKRIATGRSQAMMRCIYAFLYTMPGVPFGYYGEEIGMQQQHLPTVEGGYNRTGCRTPMQWDDSPNAGFSTAPGSALYTPVDPAPTRPTVAQREQETDAALHVIRELHALRTKHPALHNDAGFSVLFAEPDQAPFVYSRTTTNRNVVSG